MQNQKSIDARSAFVNAQAKELVMLFKESCNYNLIKFVLPKTIYTEQLELLYRKLVKNEKFSASLNENGELCIKFSKPDMTINLTTALIHGNLSHLVFDTQDFANYKKWIETENFKKDYDYAPENDEFTDFPTEAQFQEREKENTGNTPTELDYAQKLAIFIYTTSFFREINGLLRKQYTNFLKEPEKLKRTIINTLMCHSGLDKLPDHNFTGAFRYESVFSPALLQQRIEAAQEGFSLAVDGLLSTGSIPVEDFKNKVGIFITEPAIGKDINLFSRYPKEGEILFPHKNQLQFLGYQHFPQKEGDSEKEIEHILYAQPVIDVRALSAEAQSMPSDVEREQFIAQALCSELANLLDEMLANKEELSASLFSSLTAIRDEINNFKEEEISKQTILPRLYEKLAALEENLHIEDNKNIYQQITNKFKTTFKLKEDQPLGIKKK